jgi:hypothetical protein
MFIASAPGGRRSSFSGLQGFSLFIKNHNFRHKFHLPYQLQKHPETTIFLTQLKV